MEAAVANVPLNAMQIHFLQSLRFVKTDEMFQELKQIVSDKYFLNSIKDDYSKFISKLKETIDNL